MFSIAVNYASLEKEINIEALLELLLYYDDGVSRAAAQPFHIAIIRHRSSRRAASLLSSAAADFDIYDDA